MSRSEPARSEIANSARCTCSERSSRAIAPCSSATSSALRRRWSAICSVAAASVRSSAARGCRSSRSTTTAPLRHSGIASRVGAPGDRRGWLSPNASRARSRSRSGSASPATGPAGSLAGVSALSNPHSTRTSAHPGNALKASTVACATAPGVDASSSGVSHASGDTASGGSGSVIAGSIARQITPLAPGAPRQRCRRLARSRWRSGRQRAPARPSGQRS